ncbi:MAG TPA: hypothetical protein PKB00_07280 [Microthrixaceae bacterium]|nr:hypothetical protein [Microthrixaceae bacterium]
MATVPTLTFRRVWGQLDTYDGTEVQAIVLTGDVPATIDMTTVDDLVAYEVDTADAPGYTRPTFTATYEQVGAADLLLVSDEDSPACDTEGATPSAILFAEAGVADSVASLISIAAVAEGPGFADWSILAPAGFAKVSNQQTPDPSAQPSGAPLQANGSGGWKFGTPGSDGGGSAPTDMQIVDLTGETPDGDGIVRFDLADLDRTTAYLLVAVPEDAILTIEGSLDGPRGLLAIAVVGDGYPVAVQDGSNLFVPDSLGAHAVTGVLAPTLDSGMAWVAWSAIDSGGNLIEFSGGGGSGPDLSDATPADLGTAAAGTSPDASRADHVHDLPTPGDIGAATASHSHAASAITSGTIDIARIPTGTTSTTVPLGNDARFSDARTPTAHKTSHQSGGSDELTLAQSQVTNLTTDLAAKVPKSLVDAKGDLIAATADDTPARLAVGADGLPVIADSAQSIGLAYGVPSTGSGHYRDNEHYLLSRTGGRLGGSTGYAPGANKVVTWDIEILEPVKLDGEWFYVQTANTGAKMRVGIYAKSTTTGHPTGNPLVTCTEIDASTTSYKTDTFTKTGWIMPGLYAGLLATNDGTAAYRAPAIVQTTGDPACDLGRGTGTITPYLSWIASWTYSSSALPDVSAFTWTASTTIAAPFVAWKVRRS